MTYVISLRWLANPNETLAIQNFAHMNIEVIIKVKIITNLQSFLKKAPQRGTKQRVQSLEKFILRTR